MSFTLAITPKEVVGLSFVVKSNIAIYFAAFIRDLMLKLRKVQEKNQEKFFITIDNAHIHHKDLVQPLATKAKIPIVCLSPYSPTLH